jgi:hypothetical protein
MSEQAWLTVEDVVQHIDLSKPNSVIIVAPNGAGKTTSTIKYISDRAKLPGFERVYILGTSHKVSEKHSKQIAKSGVKVIHYQSVERSCINKTLLNEVISLGLEPTFACLICPYNAINKLKLSSVTDIAKTFKDIYEQPQKIISTKTINQRNLEEERICYYPIIKHIVLDPAYDSFFDTTLVIATPYHLITSRQVLQYWHEYASKQKKKKKRYIQIFDEADALFYTGLTYQLNRYEPTEFDRRYASDFLRLFDIHKEIIEIFTYATFDTNRYKQLLSLLREAKELISGKFDFIEYQKKAYKEKAKTNLIRLIGEQLQLFGLKRGISYRTASIWHLSTTVTENGAVIEDRDFTYDIILNIYFPFKEWIKIALTGTLPKSDILQTSSLLSKGKRLLDYTKSLYVIPSNVEFFAFQLFDYGEVIVRNIQLLGKLNALFETVRTLAQIYMEREKTVPRGILLVLQNKLQFNYLKKALSRYAIRQTRGFVAILFSGIEIGFTYNASPVSRGVDYDQYDISIVVAPLLRPPRRVIRYDIMDYARAVAEAVQSAFRVVRRLKVERKKYVAFERFMLFDIYFELLPQWLKIAIEKYGITFI